MRLKQSQLAAYRQAQLALQGGCCALTGKALKPEDAVVDHCHTTGVIRGVIDRGANSMLGKIENHRRLARLTSDKDLSLFLSNVVGYLSQGARKAMMPDAAIYPTHKTADEKRTLRNKRVRVKRAAAKGT